MLLDEPFSNIDTQVRMKLILEIRALLKQQGIGAIFVSHSKEEASPSPTGWLCFAPVASSRWGAGAALSPPREPLRGGFLGRVNYLAAEVVDSPACRPSLEPSAVRSPMAAR
jgi:iron(III) transport system ATP-binding protein